MRSLKWNRSLAVTNPQGVVMPPCRSPQLHWASWRLSAHYFGFTAAPLTLTALVVYAQQLQAAVFGGKAAIKLLHNLTCLTANSTDRHSQRPAVGHSSTISSWRARCFHQEVRETKNRDKSEYLSYIHQVSIHKWTLMLLFDSWVWTGNLSL